MIKKLLIALCLIMLGCTQQECQPPKIFIGSDCCDDTNSNDVCDYLEKTTQEALTNTTTDFKKVPINGEEEYQDTISLFELQQNINKTFYPFESSNFSVYELENITGIQNTYNLTNGGRFYIYQMKKPYNYLRSQDNFTDFVQRLFDIEKRKWEMDGKQVIEYNSLYNSQWDDVELIYEPNLEKVKIDGKTAYFFTHLQLFDRQGELADSYYDFRLLVPCTPQFNVELYPSLNFFFVMFIDSQVSTAKESFYDAIVKEKKNMIRDGERIVSLCNGKIDPLSFGKNEVIFFGNEGYYPPIIQLQEGQDLIIHNYIQEYYLGATFTFVREVPTRKVFLSKGVSHGNSTHVTFDEPGLYRGFFTQYNGKFYINVT